MKVLNRKFFNVNIDENGDCFSYHVKNLIGLDFALLKNERFNFLQIHELAPDKFIDEDDFENICGELIDEIIDVALDKMKCVKSLVAEHKEKIEVFFENDSTAYWLDNGYCLRDEIEISSIEEFFKELDRLEKRIDCDGNYSLGDFYASLLTVNDFLLMLKEIID